MPVPNRASQVLHAGSLRQISSSHITGNAKSSFCKIKWSPALRYTQLHALLSYAYAPCLAFRFFSQDSEGLKIPRCLHEYCKTEEINSRQLNKDGSWRLQPVLRQIFIDTGCETDLQMIVTKNPLHAELRSSSEAQLCARCLTAREVLALQHVHALCCLQNSKADARGSTLAPVGRTMEPYRTSDWSYSRMRPSAATRWFACIACLRNAAWILCRPASSAKTRSGISFCFEATHVQKQY